MASGGGDSVIVIDGSALEGGGQILRNTAALSCLLRKPVKVEKIRAGRSNPGLRPQHLTGLQLICDICQGRLQGAEVKSTEITFYPGVVKAGNFLADTHTAGSICLLMQAALPCFLMGSGPGTMTLRGGTNAEMAPQIDYTLMVFKPIAERFGVHFDCQIARRGYYPKGGGEVHVRVEPAKELTPVTLMEPGKVKRIYGRAFVAGVLPVSIAHQMKETCQAVIKQDYPDTPINIQVVKEPREIAMGNGTGIIVCAETENGCILAGSALGKKGLPAEKVGQEAGEMLLNQLWHGGCVDDFLQDQVASVRADTVGQEAGEKLLTELRHGGCIDNWSQDQYKYYIAVTKTGDGTPYRSHGYVLLRFRGNVVMKMGTQQPRQLIILMALAKGKSSIRCGPVTLHTETAIHVAKQLTDAKFTVNRISAGQTVIECEGIGLQH